MVAGIFAMFVALGSSASAYHISGGSPPAGTATDPFNFGPKTGASYPITDPTQEGQPLGVICTSQNEPGAIPVPQYEIVEDIICGDGGPTDGGQSECGDPTTPHEGVFGFCSGDTAFGFTACESNADPSTGAPAKAGSGGLCFMSAGFTTTAGDCEPTTVNGGRSNGNYDPFTAAEGSQACNTVAANPTPPTVTDYSRAGEYADFEMTEGGTPVAFASQVAGINCAASPSLDTHITYEWLHETSNGHLTGFPNGTPSGFANTYTVSTGSAGTNACNGGANWQQ